MKINESTQAQEGMARVLAGNYPRITDDQVGELLRLLGNAEAEQVMEAIDAHITSEDGRFPPQAGQILEQMRRKAQASRPDPFKRDPFEGRPRRGKKRVAVPKNMQGRTGWSHIEVWPVKCLECGDTGIARFYHDGRKRVWLATEAVDLPEEMFARLRHASAVCDCQRGLSAPERMLYTVHRRSDRDMPVYPRLEVIRRRSEQRQSRELQEVA